MSDTKKEFPTIEDAFTWLNEYVDDPCIDNHRFAYLDDPDDKDAYDEVASMGCCGSVDTIVYINSREAVIGCNYGH